MAQHSDVAWLTAYHDSILPGHLATLLAEARATTIMEYSTLVPGLLQTERYARAAIVASVPYNMARARVDQLVKLRMERQWQVFERANPPQLHILLDESVLQRQLGSQQLMVEQFRHLQSLLSASWLKLQIVPFSAPAFYFGLSNFFLYTTAGAAPVCQAYTEDVFMGDQCKEDPIVVNSYREIFRTLSLQALSEAETGQRIAQVITELEARAPQLPSWRGEVGR